MFMILLLLSFFLASLPIEQPALHFLLHRRGGRFVHHEPAELTKLFSLIRLIENRYSSTNRALEKNRLIRRWTSEQEDTAMLEEAGIAGRWHATIDVGDPPQRLEVDLELLSPDFYTILTTSQGGSKFNTFMSKSHVSGNTFVHQLCRLPSDLFHLPSQPAPISLDWPICQPSKSSRHTLFNSGTILGLAPNHPSHPSSLSRLTTSSFVHQLYQKGIIQSPIWSITLLDNETGVLSLGATLVAEVEEAKARTEVELKYMGRDNVKQQIDDEVKGRMAFAVASGSTFEDHFKWTDVSGASGWWTGLIGGVWVNGIKILKNQPFLIDPTCPFILAPPTSFARLYDAIGGAKPLSSYLSHGTFPDRDARRRHHFLSNGSHNHSETFHLFPCLNPPHISFELGGWPFPLAAPSQMTRSDAVHGPAGGLFSLGKIEEVMNSTEGQEHGGGTKNSGYCVGIVVRSDMGERTERRWRESGMRDVWVLGEPFLRGMGVVFDDGGGNLAGKARMGFRIY